MLVVLTTAQARAIGHPALAFYADRLDAFERTGEPTFSLTTLQAGNRTVRRWMEFLSSHGIARFRYSRKTGLHTMVVRDDHADEAPVEAWLSRFRGTAAAKLYPAFGSDDYHYLWEQVRESGMTREDFESRLTRALLSAKSAKVSPKHLIVWLEAGLHLEPATWEQANARTRSAGESARWDRMYRQALENLE